MTEDEKRICKRCLLFESGEKDILDDINTRINNIPPKDKTEDELYNFRLKKCSECDNLIGGVCMKCGCYPEFRAAFRKNRCPDSKNKAW